MDGHTTIFQPICWAEIIGEPMDTRPSYYSCTYQCGGGHNNTCRGLCCPYCISGGGWCVMMMMMATTNFVNNPCLSRREEAGDNVDAGHKVFVKVVVRMINLCVQRERTSWIL
mmetsp:Transcript_36051/g.40815  ORF Transcript_36051/g.40815 Transcript_36051/m.40815 type:complete len:113 (+) Transcript_36051:205-543(+)